MSLSVSCARLCYFLFLIIFVSQISKLQLKTKEERDSEAEMSQPRWTRDRQVYSLLCVGCKRPITTSDKIRSINKQVRFAVN